ncbi:MAG: hypothetical protein PW734_03595 [Verrucomicrobium sp.]|nr:hypothetical protein [Verrucomicrobium sp.]
MKQGLLGVGFIAWWIFGGMALAEDHLDSITTTDGKTYTDVVVKRSDPSGLDITHSGGAAHLLFEKLPADIEQKYGYDPAKSAAFKAAQQQEREAGAKELAAELDAKAIATALAKSEKYGSGNVFQTTENGLLIKGSYYKTTVGSHITEVVIDQNKNTAFPSKIIERQTVETTNTEAYHLGPKGGLVFIECDPSGWVDEEEWTGIIYPIGTYSYTNVMGAKVSIPRFTTDVQRAAAYLRRTHQY